MKESDIFRLTHILEAAREALSYTVRYKREDLDTDRMLIHSLIRNIEIIGEAASKLSPELKEQIPSIEWRKVVGMRNRLIHAYYDVSLDILWTTVTYNIPKIIAELEVLPYLQ